MKFTEIADYHVRPGRVTRWTASPAEAAEPVLDARPPSHLQEAHIRAKSAGEADEPSWLAVGFDVDGPLDVTALRSAFLRWLDRHETLRSGLRPREDGELERRTVPAGQVSLHDAEIGEFTCAAAISAELRELFNARTDPTSWPSYVFATVSRSDSSTVCMAFDHGNVDGYSILLVAHEIHELYRAAREGRCAELAEVGSYVDFCAQEREFSDGFERSDEAVAEWAGFVAECGGLPRFPASLAPGVSGARSGAAFDVEPAAFASGDEEFTVRTGAAAVGDPVPGDPVPDPVPSDPVPDDPASRDPVPQRLPQGGLCEWLLDAEGADAFEKACRHNGGSVFTGVLAALGLAASGMSGEGTFRTLLLMHTRSAREWAQSLGWFVGLAPIELPTPAGPGADTADVLDLLPAAGRALRGAKQLAAVPLPKVGELLGAQLTPRFVVSYMDTRLSPGSRNWNAWRAQALHAPATSADEVYVWVNRNHDGIYVTSRFPGAPTAEGVLGGYVERIRGLLGAVALGSGAPELPALWAERALVGDQAGTGGPERVGAGRGRTTAEHDALLKGPHP